MPPPIGEIQPIRAAEGKKAPPSPHHRAGGLFGKKRDKAGESPEKGGLDGISEAGEPTKGNRNSVYIDSVDSAQNEMAAEKLSELQRQLAAVEDKSVKLQLDNKQLREENERMRRYMESIVSRAIVTCPEILCVDSGLNKP